MVKKITKQGKKDISAAQSLKNKRDQNKFINMLIKQNYHITKTCKALGFSRQRYYDWMDDKDFVATLEKLREQEVDIIEDAFRDLVKEGNPQAVIFGLKTRGANRGYQERQHIEHFGAEAIIIKFIEPGEEEKDTDEEKTVHDIDPANP